MAVKDLTNGREGRLILNFALPMLIGNVFQQLYNVVDSIVVGNYIGKEALSAVGASFPIFYALISLVIGLASGTAIVISQYFGAKKYEMVQKGADTLFILLFFAAIIVSSLGIYFIDEILQLIDLPADVVPDAKIYLTYTLLGLLAAFGYNGTASLLRALGDSVTPLYFLIISTITNIALDLLFVLQFNMGVEGVAIATVISQVGAFITAIIYINRNFDIVKINFMKMKFDKKIFFKSIKVGLPAGLQQLFVAVGITAVLKIVNGFGTSVVAGYSVATRVGMFASMPAMNFAQALTAFTGQNIGAGKINRVRKGLMSTLAMSSGISVSISLIVVFGAEQIIGLFSPDPEVIRVGTEYLRIVGAFYVLFTLMFTFTGVFRGAGDTLIPMFISLFSLWIIRLPLSYYFSEKFGETGIWYAVPVAWAFGLILVFGYYLGGRWKRKGLVEKKK
ncbi:MAG: MATE family efflux transporter [Bacteroidota bacterium]|nr:MATE family efflux transporter [Bacteroidota bacterium]